MDAIRPFERRDIPEVATLVERRLYSGSRTPSADLRTFLERSVVGYPWADSEIPSLVYVDDDDRVRGFISCQVRRMRFDGEPIKAASTFHLVKDPAVRKPIGMLLLRRLLDGPQHLTLAGASTEQVSRMWEHFGGERVYVGCLRWLRLLRPWRYVAERQLQRKGGLSARGARRVRAASTWLDSGTRLTGLSLPAPNSPLSQTEPLTPETLLQHLPAVAAGLRLAPAYDQPYLDWLFEGPPRADVGERIGAIVTHGGRPLGWFQYGLSPDGIGRVATVAARDSDAAASVLDGLFCDADARGAAALLGRVDAKLVPVLKARRCLLRPGYAQLLHSRVPEISHAIHAGDALLSQLYGEWQVESLGWV